MAKQKQKLTQAQKAERRRRKREFITVFVRGKMKRIPRPPTVDGMSVEDFVLQNADPIWLHQQRLWEYMPTT
jgi:hypothetical protein